MTRVYSHMTSHLTSHMITVHATSHVASYTIPQFLSTLLFFGEDPNESTTEEFFGIFTVFLHSFTVSCRHSAPLGRVFHCLYISPSQEAHVELIALRKRKEEEEKRREEMVCLTLTSYISPPSPPPSQLLLPPPLYIPCTTHPSFPFTTTSLLLLPFYPSFPPSPPPPSGEAETADSAETQEAARGSGGTDRSRGTR